MTDMSQTPPPPCDWHLGDNISDFVLEQHPTAQQLVAGIAKAGRGGRIDAWRGNNQDRDFEPAEQSDGSWLTCCPAHDDHRPSLVVTDGVDENGNKS